METRTRLPCDKVKNAVKNELSLILILFSKEEAKLLSNCIQITWYSVVRKNAEH